MACSSSSADRRPKIMNKCVFKLLVNFDNAPDMASTCFSISDDGLILTCNSCLEPFNQIIHIGIIAENEDWGHDPSKKLKVIAQCHPKQVICRDEKLDLALMHLEDSSMEDPIFARLLELQDFPYFPFADSRYLVQGNPLQVAGFSGYSASVILTEGILSAINFPVGREFGQIRYRTDADANPGSIGGPVIIEEEMCVGILSGSIENEQNANLFIPAHKVLDLLEQRMPESVAKKLKDICGHLC